MGIEHARLFLAANRFPHLAKIAQQGFLGACAPSSPACQTPTALLALFAGAEPRESGVWGYLMPDPRRPAESISGFSASTGNIRTIWEELGSRGRTFSLMNVAFRKDRVWSGAVPGLDFGYDGYRLWEKARIYKVPRGRSRVDFQGLELDLARSRGGVVLRKGSSVRAALLPREWARLTLTSGRRAWACLLDEAHLALAPLTRPLVRGTYAIGAAADDFVDFNVHRAVRALNRGKTGEERIPIGVEMAPVALGMKQKQALMVDAIRCGRTPLVIGYFPLIDELNHAGFDLLDAAQPDPRTLELYMSCAGLVDELISRVMAEADRDTLVVLSSDHGVSAFRKTLHLNELLAEAGLVRRSQEGYDLRRSSAAVPSLRLRRRHGPGGDEQDGSAGGHQARGGPCARARCLDRHGRGPRERSFRCLPPPAFGCIPDRPRAPSRPACR